MAEQSGLVFGESVRWNGFCHCSSSTVCVPVWQPPFHWIHPFPLIHGSWLILAIVLFHLFIHSFIGHLLIYFHSFINMKFCFVLFSFGCCRCCFPSHLQVLIRTGNFLIIFYYYFKKIPLMIERLWDFIFIFTFFYMNFSI